MQQIPRRPRRFITVRRLIRTHNRIPLLRQGFVVLLMLWILVWFVIKAPFIVGLWIAIALVATIALLTVIQRQAMRHIVNDVLRAGAEDIARAQEYNRQHENEQQQDE